MAIVKHGLKDHEKNPFGDADENYLKKKQSE